MTKLSRILIAAAVTFALALPAVLAESKTVTLDGTMICALCTLKEKGREECQNVVQVKTESGDLKNYYVVQNDAGKEFGHVCKSTPAVRVTGTILEKDGQTWIEPSKIERSGKTEKS